MPMSQPWIPHHVSRGQAAFYPREMSPRLGGMCICARANAFAERSDRRCVMYAGNQAPAPLVRPCRNPGSDCSRVNEEFFELSLHAIGRSFVFLVGEPLVFGHTSETAPCTVEQRGTGNRAETSAILERGVARRPPRPDRDGAGLTQDTPQTS